LKFEVERNAIFQTVAPKRIWKCIGAPVWS